MDREDDEWGSAVCVYGRWDALVILTHIAKKGGIKPNPRGIEPGSPRCGHAWSTTALRRTGEYGVGAWFLLNQSQKAEPFAMTTQKITGAGRDELDGDGLQCRATAGVRNGGVRSCACKRSSKGTCACGPSRGRARARLGG